MFPSCIVFEIQRRDNDRKSPFFRTREFLFGMTPLKYHQWRSNNFLGLTTATIQLYVYDLPQKLEDASTHKSAKTHAGNVFVIPDLDL